MKQAQEKKLYIKTYGCQMNVYDSNKMAGLLKPLGYEASDVPDDANIIIFNTCHIREKAAEKMYSDIGRVKKFKDKNQDVIIAVAGCVGQAEGEEIFKRAPAVDIVVGPQSYQTLPELVAKIKRDKGHAINLEFPQIDKFDSLQESESAEGPAAFLSIQEGCDKFCTFCVVPYTRGQEYSRPVSKIFREANQLVATGAKEISLLGQNVNAYHGEGEGGKAWNLGQLIHHIASIKGLERIRYTTSHPRDMHEDLYKAHKEEEKLMPFLHLPVQAGGNKTLKAMNRKHTREEYFEIIDRLREARPDLALSSDFIVGFPGESDEEFEDTLDLVKRVNYAQCYSFKYSPRPGTPGAEMTNQIPEEIKAERLARLQALLNEQQLVFNQSSIGKTMPILVDRVGKKEHQLLGRSPYMQSVRIDNAPQEIKNTIVNVIIEEAHANSLVGKLVD